MGKMTRTEAHQFFSALRGIRRVRYLKDPEQLVIPLLDVVVAVNSLLREGSFMVSIERGYVEFIAQDGSCSLKAEVLPPP